MSTLNAEKLSDEEIVNYFEEAYEKQIAINNDITSFEVTCEREGGDTKILVEIIGMAGSPTPEAYKDGANIMNRDKVVVDEGEFGKLEFEYANDCYILNSTDYVAVYKLA